MRTFFAGVLVGLSLAGTISWAQLDPLQGTVLDTPDYRFSRQLERERAADTERRLNLLEQKQPC